jgi:tRNA threonylcarbamoyladenosine biosynthesis protein TsaB
MNKLSIDTSDNRRVSVELISGKEKSKIERETTTWTSQTILSVIEEILINNNLKIEQINQISVNTGPGSFTGIRVGIAVANTLGWLLDIPVNGNKKIITEMKYQ